jgi:Antirestriction protein (ArdA)
MNNHPANHHPGDSMATDPRPGNSSRTCRRIWVGSLADYNNGDLHWQWLDAARERAEIHADIQAMLARGPAASLPLSISRE